MSEKYNDISERRSALKEHARHILSSDAKGNLSVRRGYKELVSGNSSDVKSILPSSIKREISFGGKPLQSTKESEAVAVYQDKINRIAFVRANVAKGNDFSL